MQLINIDDAGVNHPHALQPVVNVTRHSETRRNLCYFLFFVSKATQTLCRTID